MLKFRNIVFVREVWRDTYFMMATVVVCDDRTKSSLKKYNYDWGIGQICLKLLCVNYGKSKLNLIPLKIKR